MYEAGVEVNYLKRTAFGGLTLPENLKEGEARFLTAEEIKKLGKSTTA